ncbi:helix-turn-helix domain-containing protein [Candidatus Dojkabacteria bacterium]|nr:helix-turn-helix domain-containing protein [Candidatus Dojkabacteria bacterium]
MTNYSLENEIQTLRKEMGMTQEELAKALGLSRQSIISMEKGDCSPSLCHAMRIAKHFDKAVEDIFTLIEKK